MIAQLADRVRNGSAYFTVGIRRRRAQRVDRARIFDLIEKLMRERGMAPARYNKTGGLARAPER